MELPKSFAGSRCLMYGFGRSNRALARYLLKEGAKIFIYDGKKTKAKVLEDAERDEIKELEVLNSLNEVKGDFLFRTPGVRPDIPEISDLVRNGTVLSSDTELFFSRAKGKIYGITGSDGKTTTTMITAKILENSFKNTEKRVFLGGNIGIPLVSFLDDITENDIVVSELSSFQLMTMKSSPQMSAITNITENHLDYHRDMKEYVEAKCRIFSGKGCNELVINTEALAFLKKECRNKPAFPNNVTEISSVGECDGVYLKNGGIYLHGRRVIESEQIKIPGLHNVENYMTAIGMTRNEASFEDIGFVAKNFRGAEHRMEFVKTVNGVSFYNSSIDSTPSRSIVTLKCFEKPLTVICGGYDKHLDYSDFALELLKKADNVVITGASAGVIKAALGKYLGYGYKCNIYYEKNFENAVERAASISVRGGKVLLSPASASFDAFVSFEERGNLFKNIVNAL